MSIEKQRLLELPLRTLQEELNGVQAQRKRINEETAFFGGTTRISTN